MQFVVNKQNLQKELGFVQGIVERKNTIPVLSNILIESVGGTTGFSSVKVNVDNSKVDTDLRGYVDIDRGFTFQRPANWFTVDYFPDQNYKQAVSRDYKQ